MADSTPSSAAYVVPETPTGKQARAEAELRFAERKAKALRTKFLRVDKHWLKQYGLETAAILAIIRDTIEIPKESGGHGVCFRKIPEVLKLAGMTHTKRHIRAFHRAKDSGEFFWARGGKTNKTYVFAADMPLLEAFLAAKGKAPNKVKAPSIIKSRRPTNDTHVNETHVKNSMYVRDFLQKNGIYLSTAEELSQMVTIEEVEEGLSEGLTEGVLVKYLRGEYIEPVKVSRSAAPDYAQGQFADFWDT